jgi:hypothetical protein
MLDRMLKHADLIEMLDDLARKRRLVGPVRRGERFLYEEVTDPRQLDLLFTYCVFGHSSPLRARTARFAPSRCWTPGRSH